MDWIQFAIFFIGVGGLWLWARAESSSDRREMVNLILSGQKESREQFKEAREEFKGFREESKDFHARLCVLEERYLQILQKAIDSKADK
jgi:hypothetical protein